MECKIDTRVERLRLAARDFEIPLKDINKQMVEGFFKKYENEYTEKEIENLKNVKLVVIKYIAKNEVGTRSWNEISSVYNEIDHYKMKDVFNYILNNGIDNSIRLYKDYKRRELMEDRVGA